MGGGRDGLQSGGLRCGAFVGQQRPECPPPAHALSPPVCTSGTAGSASQELCAHPALAKSTRQRVARSLLARSRVSGAITEMGLHHTGRLPCPRRERSLTASADASGHTARSPPPRLLRSNQEPLEATGLPSPPRFLGNKAVLRRRRRPCCEDHRRPLNHLPALAQAFGEPGSPPSCPPLQHGDQPLPLPAEVHEPRARPDRLTKLPLTSRLSATLLPSFPGRPTLQKPRTHLPAETAERSATGLRASAGLRHGLAWRA